MNVALPHLPSPKSILMSSVKVFTTVRTRLLVVILRECSKVMHVKQVVKLPLCGHVPVRTFTEKRAELRKCKQNSRGDKECPCKMPLTHSLRTQSAHSGTWGFLKSPPLLPILCPSLSCFEVEATNGLCEFPSLV